MDSVGMQRPCLGRGCRTTLAATVPYSPQNGKRDGPGGWAEPPDRVGAPRARLGRELCGLGLELGAQPGRRRAQDPRYLHLRDADLLADLALGEVLDEAEVQHEPVA